MLGKVLKWFESDFMDRSQFISVGGYSSDFSSVLTGVPQGSVLGPFTFQHLFISTWAVIVWPPLSRLF